MLEGYAGRPGEASACAAASGEPPLLVVVGPTAVGKSALAVQLALRLDGEILTADAMQVYRGMDIGTDKPPPETRGGVPHHLIDLVDPHCPFSAALYREFALRALEDVRRRGRLPIVCGGTGLYIRAFVDDRLPPSAGYHPEVRARLQAEVERLGAPALHRRLAELDPPAAARIHPHDARRIVRALEVLEATATPISALQERARRLARPHPAVWVGLTRPRPELYRRIERRVDDQIRRGLVEEVRRLLASGLRPGQTAMQGLGYKEVACYLRGEVSFGQAVERLKRSTRHYARRQLIWFRPDPRIRWFDLSAYPDVSAAADAIAAFVRERLAGHGGRPRA